MEYPLLQVDLLPYLGGDLTAGEGASEMGGVLFLVFANDFLILNFNVMFFTFIR